jgi:hypothetical protein
MMRWRAVASGTPAAHLDDPAIGAAAAELPDHRAVSLSEGGRRPGDRRGSRRRGLQHVGVLPGRPDYSRRDRSLTRADDPHAGTGLRLADCIGRLSNFHSAPRSTPIDIMKERLGVMSRRIAASGAIRRRQDAIARREGDGRQSVARAQVKGCDLRPIEPEADGQSNLAGRPPRAG